MIPLTLTHSHTHSLRACHKRHARSLSLSLSLSLVRIHSCTRPTPPSHAPGVQCAAGGVEPGAASESQSHWLPALAAHWPPSRRAPTPAAPA